MPQLFTVNSILTDGYVFHNRFVLALLKLNALFHKKNSIYPALPTPNKILISNIGYIGDFLISLNVLLALKDVFPDASFGFLISSRAQSATGLLPIPVKIHTYDHFIELKNTLGPWKAALHHFQSRRRIIQEICKETYDWAIDLQPFYPNSLPILYRASIPSRIGYPTAGNSHLLTHAFNWKSFDKYIGELHLEHLNQIGVKCPISFRTTQLTPQAVDAPDKYILIHMSSSKREKDWERPRWIDLIQKLKNANYEIILTGLGNYDETECASVAAKTSCLNYCNQLSISQLYQLICKAKLLITVDSAPLHLGANQVPILVLFSTINSPHIWIPSPMKHAKVRYINESKTTPTPEEVFQDAMELLSITSH